jgi:monoamine oxidase
MRNGSTTVVTKRELLALIGTIAGSAAMYNAMTGLGLASDSAYTGPVALSGEVKPATR